MFCLGHKALTQTRTNINLPIFEVYLSIQGFLVGISKVVEY